MGFLKCQPPLPPSKCFFLFFSTLHGLGQIFFPFTFVYSFWHNLKGTGKWVGRQGWVNQKRQIMWFQYSTKWKSYFILRFSPLRKFFTSFFHVLDCFFQGPLLKLVINQDLSSSFSSKTLKNHGPLEVNFGLSSAPTIIASHFSVPLHSALPPSTPSHFNSF